MASSTRTNGFKRWQHEQWKTGTRLGSARMEVVVAVVVVAPAPAKATEPIEAALEFQP
jgi:hypothetical protein